MTDKEKLKLIYKLAADSFECNTLDGDSRSAYYEATIAAIQIVATFGTEEDND